MTNQEVVEQQALRLSVIGAIGMALLGILFALLTGSEAVLLDGLFSLVSFAMGLFTLKVSRLVAKPDDERFQLGYANFEPFVNTSKGLIMSFLCIYALYSAIDSLFQGGRPIASGYALLYAAIAVLGCFAIAHRQQKALERTKSPLIEVETKGWRMDGYLSSAVLVAFLILLLIEKTSWAVYAPYADPLIVIILVVAAAPMPISIVRKSMRELLLGAPEPDVQENVRAKLKAATRELPLESTILRMVKIGRSTHLQVHLVVSESHRTASLSELDTVRENIAFEMEDITPHLTMDVMFTLNPKWTQPFDETLRI
jgi:cation diffusion facilitator family transporter